MCVCIYTHAHTHTRTHTHCTHTHTAHTHVHTRTRTHTHAHTYIQDVREAAKGDHALGVPRWKCIVIVMKLHHDEITPRWVFTNPDSWYRVGPGPEPVQTRLFWVARTMGRAAICSSLNCGLGNGQTLCIMVHCACIYCASTAPYVLRDRYGVASVSRID